MKIPAETHFRYFGETDRNDETIYVTGYMTQEEFPIYPNPLIIERGFTVPKSVIGALIGFPSEADIRRMINEMDSPSSVGRIHRLFERFKSGERGQFKIPMKYMAAWTYEEVAEKHAKLLYEFLEGEYRSFEEYLTLIHKNLQRRS